MILTANVVAPVLLVVLWPTSPLLAIASLLGAHMLALYPTLAANSQWWGPVVTRFSPGRPDALEVWLTIDDGPDPEDTPRILDLLDAHHAHATFFVKGSLAERHPELLREISGRGHQIGNHSHTHPSGTWWCLGPARIAREIDLASRAIQNAIDQTPHYFRAPVGMKNWWVHPRLRGRGMKLIGWSSRGWDTVATTPLMAAARIMRDIGPGVIVLVHEGRAVSAHRGFEVLEQLLPRLTQEGFRCVIPKDDQLL